MKILLLVSVFLGGCATGETPDPTCDDVLEAGAMAPPEIECGVHGYGYVAAGVSYYDETADITWFQHVRELNGVPGVVGQIDEWAAGCYWLPCDVVR